MTNQFEFLIGFGTKHRLSCSKSSDDFNSSIGNEKKNRQKKNNQVFPSPWIRILVNLSIHIIASIYILVSIIDQKNLTGIHQ